MDIKRILYAMNFSEKTINAFPYVTGMARQFGSQLYLVHVIPDLGKVTKWYAPKLSMKDINKIMEERANTELEKLCAEQQKECAYVEYRLLKGDPSEEIVRFHEDNKIDLIILGSHGSIADKVMNRSLCPVLIMTPHVKKESTYFKLCSGGTEIRL